MALLISIFMSFLTASAQDTNVQNLYQQFEQELQSPNGVQVEVHGADHQNGMYAIAYRPKNFFDYVIISLQADDFSPNYQMVVDQLKTLRRHDFLQIKGESNSSVFSPQSHVMVSDLVILNKFSSSYDSGTEYKHYTDVMKEVAAQTSLIVKVHASLMDGTIFMAEYGDANFPIIVKNNIVTKTLYRGDKVKIQFKVKKSLTSPAHVVLDKADDSVVVLDKVVDLHGKPQDRCGELVMFPQSPQVKFNVFALKTDIGDNLFRTFTLINFDDVNLFLALRDKMQVVWDANTATMVQGRNYFLNPKLKVCAKGTGNMIVPTQANPQIIVDKLEDLTVEVIR